jgi:two-component system sensor histidine kinase TctE
MCCAMCHPAKTRSIRTSLLLWVLLPLTAVGFARAGFAYRQAYQAANLVYDDALLASARAIGEQVHATNGVFEALIPPSALERLGRPQRDRVAYRVDDPSGDILAGYPDTPAPPTLAGADILFFDAVFRSQPMRVVSISQPIAGATGSARVTVGETLQSRETLAAGFWRLSLAADFAALALAAGFIVVGVARGLAPLDRIRAAVLARPTGSLDPIAPSGVPREVAPLVDALNDAVARAAAQIAQRERLVADAAHQLRTPVALLLTQAAVGAKGSDSGAKDSALSAIATTAGGMARLTNQLLVLAQAEAYPHLPAQGVVDLRSVAQQVLSELGPRALDLSLALSFNDPAVAVRVAGPVVLIEELLRNVVDNALRHGASGGEIDVGLACCNGMARLIVRDRGKGIPGEFRDRVFDRFCRVPGTSGEGSGLGLAIVREIAVSRGGSVRLREPEDGGLAVEIDLPLAS